MPHIIVKLWPGKTDRQKRLLADAIAENVKSVLDYGDESVSVAVEEVPANKWAAKVYGPDIKAKWNSLLKKPGYTC